MNIYVGNLPREATEEDIKLAFEAFGQVASAAIIKDKYTGESRGFAFVEMPNKEEATAAIAGMNGKSIKGSAITVNEARPRTEGGGRSNFRSGGGGGYHSGGGSGGGGGYRGGGGGGGGDRRGGGGDSRGGTGRRSW